MSLKNVTRRLPLGILAVLTILLGTSIAQVVPVAGSREKTEKPAAPPTFMVPPNGTTSVRPPLAPTPPTVTVRTSEDSDNEINVLIAQALDQPTDLDLKEADIRDAVAKLAAKTGIPIEIEQGTLGLLPYGAKTTLSATIKNRPLSDSLTALLRPIGLQFVVESRRVLIRPTPPLRRVVDRATWDDLALLEKLYKTPWSEEFAKKQKFQFQAVAPTAEVAVDFPSLIHSVNSKTVGNTPFALVLDQALGDMGWTWYPSNNAIVALPKKKQYEHQLEKRVNTVYSRAQLAEVLQDLATKAGVPLRFDPGVLTLLPSGMDRFTLSFQNTPIRQILELISGQTGLAYTLEGDALRITPGTLSSSTTRPAPATDNEDVARLMSQLKGNPIVGQMTIPGGKDGKVVTLFIRYDDLPPDLKDALPQLKSQAIDVLRDSFKTSTKPTP